MYEDNADRWCRYWAREGLLSHALRVQACIPPVCSALPSIGECSASALLIPSSWRAKRLGASSQKATT